MIKGIKEKDIRDFEKHAKKLGEIIERIVEYCPTARIYITPQQINLIAAWPEDTGMDAEELTVSTAFCGYIESGDW